MPHVRGFKPDFSTKQTRGLIAINFINEYFVGCKKLSTNGLSGRENQIPGLVDYYF